MEKSQALNNHFSSVFVQDDGLLHDVGSSVFTNITNLIFDINGVKKQLNELNANKACGPDNLSPRVLKLLADELSLPLTFIFQQSFDTGKVPADWSKALVAPVYKNDGKQNPKNYRPITVIISLAGLFSKLLNTRLSQVVEM